MSTSQRVPFRRVPARRSVVVAVTLSAAVLGGACSSDSSDSSDGTTTTTTAAERSTTTTEATGTVIDAPGPVALAVGEKVTLELQANPTTGYQWEPSAEPDGAVIRIVSDTYVAGGSDAMGAGGTQEVVIEGVGAGTTTLELRYVRPWETDVPPAETASYEITVS